MYHLLAEITITGQPPRKSNQRQLVRRGRGKNARPMFIKSKEARAYVKHFKEIVSEEDQQQHGSLDENLRVDIAVWYTSRRPDLSVELILDCLEAAKVIKNDRYIREVHTYGFVDKENPRIKLRLFRISHEREPPIDLS
jgi:Holliday junction resolvase RusA-like endonuclease